MNKNGFLIDQKKLKSLSKKFKEKIIILESEIFEITNEIFNIKSTQQVSKILFEKMGLPIKGLKKTPKGVISTKESELQKLIDVHPIIKKILSYRELTKLVSTYLDNLQKLISDDGRLRATFLQTGTSTGRMSSKEPNLQNIPTRTASGREIRSFFIAEKESSLVSCDYSQIELRVAALMSQDKKLLEIFKKGGDIHTAVAIDIFGDETAANRRKAKIINFGILYGMGATSLRKNLGGETTLQDAREYLNKYFDKYSGLADYLEKTKQKVQERGYSETLFGRKKFFPDINSKIPFLRAMAERMALNAPIQGTATGDIIKLAMIDVTNNIEKTSQTKNVKFLAQVHDELIFEIKDEKLDEIVPEIKKTMEAVLENSKLDQKYKTIPIIVDVAIGKN